MIAFVRVASVKPGKQVAAMGFAKEIVGFLKSHHHLDVEVLRPVGGNPQRIAWSARYADLVEDRTLRDNIFGMIRDEHARTVRMHAAITGNDHLLADNPSLAESIHNRFPYLEPLNQMQVELLRRLRAGDDSELVKRGILLTMNGLATALRNSG